MKFSALCLSLLWAFNAATTTTAQRLGAPAKRDLHVRKQREEDSSTTSGGIEGLKKYKDMNFVLNYDDDISLDEVDDVVRKLGATVGRQLKCTRGVTVFLNKDLAVEQDKLELPSGFRLTPMSETHQQNLPADRLGLELEESNNRKLESCDVCPTQDNYRIHKHYVAKIKNAIKENIDLDTTSFAGSKTNSIGELLRLVFHDLSAFDVRGNEGLSGLNGCVDMLFPSNAGLQAAVSFLQGVRAGIAATSEGGSDVISTADLHVLGAITAVEAAGGPSIPFRYGRIDTPCECETNFFPNPESDLARTGTGELDETMVNRLGLSPTDITALLGSHTVGRLEEHFSGYSGGWIPPAERSIFNNTYYIVMLERPWVKTTKMLGDTELTEWRSPLLEIDAMMLNIDAVLGFEIDDGCNVFGNDPLGFLSDTEMELPDPIVDCTRREDEYGEAAAAFAASNGAFFSAYTDAFVKMVETTFPCGTLQTLDERMGGGRNPSPGMDGRPRGGMPP